MIKDEFFPSETDVLVAEDLAIDKDELIRQVERKLATQFDPYSWSELIDEALEDYTDEERIWAKENLSIKLDILDPDYE